MMDQSIHQTEVVVRLNSRGKGGAGSGRGGATKRGSGAKVMRGGAAGKRGRGGKAKWLGWPFKDTFFDFNDDKVLWMRGED